jgi:hypothetical protein
VFISKFLYFLALLWAATAGKIGPKRQSLGSQKDLSFSNWQTEVFSVFRSKILYFLAFYGQLRLEKFCSGTGLKRQSLNNRQNPSLSS